MGAIFLQLLQLLVIDLLFIGLLVVSLVPMAMFKKASYAIVKRNVIGYFSNPTGYVFLCVFVLLSSLAAFWTDEFFVANLANLDQLSKYMPWLLLFFIPAITMSIWSEERRQGTDELLLTLPATDFDIVFGKYIAAAVIFTLSLLFAQVSSYTALAVLSLGDLDIGLIVTTYVGYWLMGLAMLGLGMVASFLTSNATVSFVLALVFNAALVLIAYIDRAVSSPSLAGQVMQWSFWAQFDSFGRGVISFAAAMFFISIAALGIVISMVLIGQRHWSGRSKAQVQSELTTLTIGVALGLLALGAICFVGTTLTSHPRALLALQWGGGSLLVLSLLTINAAAIINAMQGGMLGHYMLRIECLIVALFGACFIFSRHDFFRTDLTHGKVSSLSPDTIKLIRKLDSSRPVTIDAFISADLPKEFIRTKYNLISSLKELSQFSGGKIKVNIHDNLELYSEEADLAETRFGIKKQTFQSQDREKMTQEQLIIGAAFTCGLEKVVVPFFGHGLPVEYELVRSIATVSQGERKKLGVVNTDAQLYGGFSMMGMTPRSIPKQPLIDELEKQYKVEQVDLSSPLELDKYDALLVVQPSSLGPEQLSNLVDAIRAGQPCAIFEDPLPGVFGQGTVVGTAAPKPPQGGFMGMGGPPPPKGDIRALWDVLGIKPLGDTGPANGVPGKMVWQRYNPYPRFAGGLGPELVFIRGDAPHAEKVFNFESPMVAGMEELLMLFPGAIEPAIGTKNKFVELVATNSDDTGEIDAERVRELQGNMSLREKEWAKTRTNRRYTLAAEIIGPEMESKDEKKDDQEEKKDGDKQESKDENGKKPKRIHCVYVCDIDCLEGFFLENRNMPNPKLNFRFDNVVFALNAIDVAAGDDRFLQIRLRKPQHSTLRLIEQKVSRTREAELEAISEAQREFDEGVRVLDETAKKEIADFEKRRDEYQKLQDEGKLDTAGLAEFRELQRELRVKMEVIEQRKKTERDRLQKKLDQKIARTRREGDRDIERTQNSIKIAATSLPMVFPLLIGIAVFAQRRVREREGVSKSRLRY
jgi:ABC-2 type transport system permease protein